MTDPSQYFRGRTVQEQMNEVIGYVDTRSAEVATDAIAADVAQVHSDAADAHADALAAAASAAAAAGTLANAVKKTGEASQNIAGDIAVAGDLSGGTVTVPTPTNNTDAASKKYVDDADALKINITDINQYGVGLTGDQDFVGIKNAKTGVEGKIYHRAINTSSTADNTWAKAFSLELPDNGVLMVDVVSAFNNADTQNATVKIYRRDGDSTLGCVVMRSDGTIASMASATNYVAVLDGNVMTFYTKKVRRYTNLRARIWWFGSYGGMADLPTVTWLNTVASDPSGETHDRIAVGVAVTYHNEA